MTAVRGRTLVALLALVALVGGCSGSAASTPGATARPVVTAPPAPAATTPPVAVPASPASSAAVDGSAAACRIVSPAAVGAATGFTVANASGTDTICIFQNADTSAYLSVSLFGNQAAMASMMQIEPGSAHIDGLGDDAFWVFSAGLLFVRQGDHGLEFLDPDLAASGPTDNVSRDALIVLARTALPNL